VASATVQRTGLAEDYAALTGACGLLERSERGKLALTGAGAAEFLNGQVTNDIARLRPGEGCYAAFLTPKGKMLGDLRVLACGPPDAAGDAPEAVCELLLDTERVALQALFDMIRRYRIGYDVQLHKRTLECSLLSLIGPRARAIAAAACQPAVACRPGAAPASALREPPALALPGAEHSHVPAHIAGASVRLICTRAPGVDVLLHAAQRDAVRDALLQAGAAAVSEQAAEALRVEQGIPRYGIDMDDTTIPQEAGLNERAVSFTKGCYVGQETVARLHYRGKPNRHLRGLRLSAPVPRGAELRLGERTMGSVSSAVLSPRLGPIGLALVRREAQPGARLQVRAPGAATAGALAEAEVVALPFA
jgi:folate-binding protein YgfZ